MGAKQGLLLNVFLIFIKKSYIYINYLKYVNKYWQKMDFFTHKFSGFRFQGKIMFSQYAQKVFKKMWISDTGHLSLKTFGQYLYTKYDL